MGALLCRAPRGRWLLPAGGCVRARSHICGVGPWHGEAAGCQDSCGETLLRRGATGRGCPCSPSSPAACCLPATKPLGRCSPIMTPPDAGHRPAETGRVVTHVASQAAIPLPVRLCTVW